MKEVKSEWISKASESTALYNKKMKNVIEWYNWSFSYINNIMLSSHFTLYNNVSK